MSRGSVEPRKLSEYELWYGRDEPPPQETLLHAGPLTALWTGGDLRRVRAGKIELLRRAYASVRDENWDTIPAQIRDLTTEIRDDRFVIAYDVEYRSRNLEFHARIAITGEQSSKITLSMSGRAERNFSYSRIGFCILHPLSEYCGQPFSGRGPVGPVSGDLPVLIGPQRYEGGFYFPLFPSVSSLSISLKSGIKIHHVFEGDLFEMEDQRNWTDGSFKTYSTPLSLGYPHQAHAGQVFGQQVTITVKGHTAQGGAEDATVQLSVGPSLHRPLPALGLGAASHDKDFSQHEADLLRKLHADHLRVDVHLSQRDSTQQLARAERECKLLGCALELALFVTENAAQELSFLASRLPLSVPVARVLVIHEKEAITSPKWVNIAREELAAVLPQVPLGGGTNLFFADLIRSRPDVTGFDAITYPICPQVHAFDEASLVENLEGQAATVTSAREFSGTRSIVVSPITLKLRFNPDAIGPEPPTLPGQLPGAVDPRQMSLFAAAWTVGSIKNLAEAGASSLTYFETTGWRGVLEMDQGCPQPELFHSLPSMVFPVYHVFADLADLKDAELLACNSSDPLRVTALALTSHGSVRILVANLTAHSQQFNLTPVAANHVEARSLDASNAWLAATNPPEFRSEVQRFALQTADSSVSFALPPYGILRIDYVPAAPHAEGRNL